MIYSSYTKQRQKAQAHSCINRDWYNSLCSEDAIANKCELSKFPPSWQIILRLPVNATQLSCSPFLFTVSEHPLPDSSSLQTIISKYRQVMMNWKSISGLIKIYTPETALYLTVARKIRIDKTHCTDYMGVRVMHSMASKGLCNSVTSYN